MVWYLLKECDRFKTLGSLMDMKQVYYYFQPKCLLMVKCLSCITNGRKTQNSTLYPLKPSFDPSTIQFYPIQKVFIVKLWNVFLEVKKAFLNLNSSYLTWIGNILTRNLLIYNIQYSSIVKQLNILSLN